MSLETKPAESQSASSNTAQTTQLNPLFDELQLAKLLKGKIEGLEENSDLTEKDTTEVEEKVSTQEEDQTLDTPDDDLEEVHSQPKENSEEDETLLDDESRYSNRTKARIEKLVAEKKEHERIAEQAKLEAKEATDRLRELQSNSVPLVSNDNPFGNISDHAKLEEEFKKARTIKRWCEDNPEGCEVGEKQFSATEIKEIRRKVEDAMEVHLPARAQYLQRYNGIRPEVEKIAPWIKDKNSVQYGEMLRVKSMFPAIVSLPEHEVFICDYLEGRKSRIEREKQAVNPVKKVVKQAPKQPGIPTSGTVRVDKEKESRVASQKSFFRTGTEHDLAKILKGMV